MIRTLKRWLLTIKLFIEDFAALETGKSRLPKANDKERTLIKQLRQELNAIAGNEAGKTWKDFSMRLRAYSRFFDPRRFLRWHVIRQTMFMASAYPPCIEELQKDAQWKNVWQPLIQEDIFGDPIPDPVLPESSGNRIIHAYHLLEMQKATGVRFDQLETIVEFGGGYGSISRLLRKLGFKGNYVFYDLPEFLALQRFYLEGIDQKTFSASNFNANEKGQNVLVGTPEDLKKVLASLHKEPSMFIATWSLSESPVSVREQVLPLVSNSSYFLFGYQPQFDTVDNVAFFRQYSKNNQTIEWKEVFKSMWNGYYLFGRKK